jgi:hypothetical protein
MPLVYTNCHPEQATSKRDYYCLLKRIILISHQKKCETIIDAVRQQRKPLTSNPKFFPNIPRELSSVYQN